ncbi:uncharacterized [Tachysurus ichikawai]
MTSCPMKSHGLIHSSLENHVFTHNVLGEGQPQEESDSVREFHARGARYCVKMIAVWKDLVVKRQCVIADRCRLQNRSRLRRLCGTQAATERE